MFNAQMLREKMQAQPFEPFRLHMSDGKTYDVPNHDAAFVQRSTIHVGLDLDREGFASRFVDLSILHITAIESVQHA